MQHYRCTVILEREEEGGFHAFVPALRGCHTQGDTEEEALVNAQEAITIYIESLKAHGEPVPAEDLVIRPVEVGV
jgi:predicted RNase H-like HicB family nuclease